MPAFQQHDGCAGGSREKEGPAGGGQGGPALRAAPKPGHAEQRRSTAQAAWSVGGLQGERVRPGGQGVLAAPAAGPQSGRGSRQAVKAVAGGVPSQREPGGVQAQPSAARVCGVGRALRARQQPAGADGGAGGAAEAVARAGDRRTEAEQMSSTQNDYFIRYGPKHRQFLGRDDGACREFSSWLTACGARPSSPRISRRADHAAPLELRARAGDGVADAAVPKSMMIASNIAVHTRCSPWPTSSSKFPF